MFKQKIKSLQYEILYSSFVEFKLLLICLDVLPFEYDKRISNLGLKDYNLYSNNMSYENFLKWYKDFDKFRVDLSKLILEKYNHDLNGNFDILPGREKLIVKKLKLVSYHAVTMDMKLRKNDCV